MSRINVLHVRVIANAGGGPDKTILRSERYIDSQKFNLQAAYIYPAGTDCLEQLQQSYCSKMEIFGIPENNGFSLKTIKNLIQICRDNHIHIWHSHDYKTDILGLIIKRFHPMKLVTTVHGFTCENMKTRFYAWLNKQVYRYYDHVICVNEQLRELCLSKRSNGSNTTYIPNGIDTKEYLCISDLAKPKKNQLNIGVVSRFSAEKGVERSLLCLRRLLDNGIDAKLHLAGDGPEKENLKKIARELDIESNIVWRGWLNDLQAFHTSLDLLLIPSYTEGFPNAILEALLLKTPVAATNVGAIPEILDGECGLLLDNNDAPQTWADQIKTIYHAGLFSEYVQRAYEKVTSKYTFQKRCHRVANVYETVLT
ncbi:GDP-mannose-dependent alpha-(1-6)-phosphatidylinositol dimannoside mannosyltransferase [Poriferisphaera corsica]|uniref:GDP-mannose-dependent alpha-(1-6)-phosphatidylinositol dimannoside mannosyltransferase n=1 Tax=Poriferisphaera corsica TaxID=2528020 RepID=A0A517YUR7_9BACT|nr:glycosyltransferase family 4 protein [Poriferisphaera corsica]QDU33971.1 GDP-mannose-dependent alpha-(1-6)-phosphatidylinositol dimannoside mannosyltransferase [Poriferisphaera corsica]